MKELLCLKNYLILLIIIIASCKKEYNNPIETWVSYNMTDGLTGNYIRAIAIDLDNNKWFCTNRGVSKFDGINWTNYTSENTTNLGNALNIVTSIAIDNQNIKWFGTWYGLIKFDDINWTIYDTVSGLVNNNINGIAIDKQDNKWIATKKGVSKFNDKNWTSYKTENGLISNYIEHIKDDDMDNIWFAYGDSVGVTKFDGIHWTTYNKTNNGLMSNVLEISKDYHGNIWILLSSGPTKFDGNNWQTIEFDSFCFPFSFIIDKQSNIWIGTMEAPKGMVFIGYNGGVRKFNGNWTTFTSDDGLVNNSVISIAIDNQNNKWFGTINGVSKFGID